MPRRAVLVGGAAVGLAVALVGASLATGLLGRDAGEGDAAHRGDRPSAGDGWRLTWSDEFDGAEGDPPRPDRWVAEIGGEGWGNEERQYYTDDRANSALDGDGRLVLTARSDSSGLPCWYGECGYTSARLITKDRFTQAYGRFEARIKLPRGQGIWPAFWLLGDDIDTVGWPTSGEIDIMEYLGHEEDTVHGALHGPGYDDDAEHTAPGSFADDFHVFSVDWSKDRIDFAVDGRRYHTATRPASGDGDGDADEGWVFDHPFFLLLNVAVGGRWPGDPDATTTFPQQMIVDYVRVYAAED